LRLGAGANLFADADKCKNQAPIGAPGILLSPPRRRQEIARGNLIPRTLGDNFGLKAWLSLFFNKTSTHAEFAQRDPFTRLVQKSYLSLLIQQDCESLNQLID